MRRLMHACSHCGKPNCEAVLNDMCKECASRYSRYQRLKKKAILEPSALVHSKLYAVVAEYKVLKAQGYKVPRDI